MAWDCACGISNKDNEGVCSGCGWSREKSNAYQRGEIPASSLDTASIVARQDLTVKLGIGGALLGGLVGYLLRPSIFLIGKLPFFTVITRGASLSGFEQILVPAAQESFNIMFIGVIIGSVGGLILSSIVSKTSTYSTGATEAGQTAAPAFPAGQQTPPRSESRIEDRIADPQVAAKFQAYRIRLQKEPGNIAVLGEYGDFLARQGAVDEALVQYFTIIELQSENTSTRRKIVELYRHNDNIPKAVDQLHQLLQIRPDDIQAQEELSRLTAPAGENQPPSMNAIQGQILGPAPLQESAKIKGNKNSVILIAGAVGGAALIVIAFLLIKQKQPVNFLKSLSSTSENVSSAMPGVASKQSVGSEIYKAIVTNSEATFTFPIPNKKVWDYGAGGLFVNINNNGQKFDIGVFDFPGSGTQANEEVDFRGWLQRSQKSIFIIDKSGEGGSVMQEMKVDYSINGTEHIFTIKVIGSNHVQTLFSSKPKYCMFNVDIDTKKEKRKVLINYN